jgi:hypothetical protein
MIIYLFWWKKGMLWQEKQIIFIMFPVRPAQLSCWHVFHSLWNDKQKKEIYFHLSMNQKIFFLLMSFILSTFSESLQVTYYVIIIINTKKKYRGKKNRQKISTTSTCVRVQLIVHHDQNDGVHIVENYRQRSYNRRGTSNDNSINVRTSDMRTNSEVSARKKESSFLSKRTAFAWRHQMKASRRRKGRRKKRNNIQTLVE